MDKDKSKFTAQANNYFNPKNREAKGDCIKSKSSSHTQFYRKVKPSEAFQRITKAEYHGESESITGTSDTFHCIHGPEGKQYTEKELLKRNLLKELDPISTGTYVCCQLHCVLIF